MRPRSARASELVDWIAAGEKPREAWRLGTEHEKVPFYRASHAPVPYEGERGIRALARGPAGATGWEPILEDGHPIGLSDEGGGGAISLEPGGQFELSGAPLADPARDRGAKSTDISREVKAVGEPTRHRLPDARHEPALDPGRDAA